MGYKIIRNVSHHDSTSFFNDAEDILQVGIIVKSSDETVKRHKHNKIMRKTFGTAEALYCLRGAGTMHFMENDETNTVDVPFKRDDLIIFDGGIHSFTFESYTLLLEVKNGPYFGQNLDKEILE